MPTKKEKVYADLGLNPNNIGVGDTVLKDCQIGLVTDIVNNNGNKVLQFWVKWATATATVPTPELASSLQKIDPIPHDLVNTTFPDGSFVQSFILRDNQIRAIITKNSGLPVLFSLEQLQSKLEEGNRQQATGNSEQTVNIYTLTIDPNLQQRVKLNQDTVYDYSIALSEGEIFPPITVWRCVLQGNGEQGTGNSETLYLVDGFHRVEAAKLAKIDELPYIEKSGSYREAMLFTISVNADHGLRRNNADKRKAVMALFNDPEWSQLSTRELAKLAKVSHQLVHKMRLEIADTERRQQNLQTIKDYWLDNNDNTVNNDSKEGNGELGTGNSEQPLPTTPPFQYPEDAIKFLDDFDDEDEEQTTADSVLQGNGEQATGNSVLQGNGEQATGNSEQTVNIYTNTEKEEKFTTPDIIPLNEYQYSLICDRPTIEALEKFMKAEGIESLPKALSQLLNLYRLSKNSP